MANCWIIVGSIIRTLPQPGHWNYDVGQNQTKTGAMGRSVIKAVIFFYTEVVF